jgi:hypothetical protein
MLPCPVLKRGARVADQQLKVIQFSRTSSLPDLTQTRPLKIRGEVMFSRRLQSSIARSVDRPLPETLLRLLRKLDAEQLQIVTIVAAAIERGAM